jgi:DNA repair protein RecO (recombination protein O)
MNERFSVEAIVLKRWDFGEKDQIVSFISREKGKHQGIAKGAKASRHRFAGALDLFSHVHLSYKEKKTSSLVFIEEARLLDGFPKIRENYNSILLANAFLEMTYRFYKEGEGESRGFAILREALKRLEGQEVKRELFWSTLLENLDSIGLAPHFHECIKCGRETKGPFLGFDVWGGGMVCSRCSSPSSQWMEIPDSLLGWLNSSKSSQLISLPPQDETLLDKILRHHLKIQMDLELEWNRFFQFLE